MPLYPPPASGGGAPADATYITQTANATLSAEQALGALATGLLKNTTATGVQSIAIGDVDFPSITTVALKAPLASPVFTGVATIPTPFTLGAISVTTTGTELNYVAGVTSAIQTQINAKQATLVSATNIKTINGSTLLGSGDLVVTGAAATFNPNLQTSAADQTVPALSSVFLFRQYRLTSTAKSINHGFLILKN